MTVELRNLRLRQELRQSVTSRGLPDLPPFPFSLRGDSKWQCVRQQNFISKGGER